MNDDSDFQFLETNEDEFLCAFVIVSSEPMTDALRADLARHWSEMVMPTAVDAMRRYVLSREGFGEYTPA